MTTRLVTTHTVPRAERGIGALAIAVDGHSNSGMAGNVGSPSFGRHAAAVLTAGSW